MELRHQARPHLEILRERTKETVNLMVIEDGLGVFIDRVESLQTIRMVSAMGTREHLHCSAVGKALLAFLSEEEVDMIVCRHGLPRYTSNAITDCDELKRHLSEIRKRGYSIDDEETGEGNQCIGTPILNHLHEVVAAVSLAAPSYRLNRGKIKQFAPMVVRTERDISESLGKSINKAI